MAKVDWSQFTPVEDKAPEVDWSQFTPVEAPTAGAGRGSVNPPMASDEIGMLARMAASGQNPVRDRTFGEIASDTGVQLLEGAANIAGAIPSLVAPESGLAETTRQAAQYWNQKQSEPIRQRMAMADREISAAGEDGVIAQVVQAAKQYSSDPALAARFVTTNLASMIPGISAAKLAQATALARGATALKAAGVATTAAGGTNAVLNAGGARGGAYEEIKKAAEAQGFTPEEAEAQAIAGSRLPAVVGAVTGYVSGKTGLEKALVGNPASALGKSAVAKGVTSGAVELAGEQMEEVLPQIATNYEAATFDGRALTKDIGRTMVETAIGASPGAAFSGVSTGLANRQPADMSPEVDIDVEYAKAKGLLPATPTAPKVEDQPTTPTVPKVRDPIASMNDEAMLAGIPIEGQDGQTNPSGQAPAAAPTVQPPGGDSAAVSAGQPAATVPNAGGQPAVNPAQPGAAAAVDFTQRAGAIAQPKGTAIPSTSNLDLTDTEVYPDQVLSSIVKSPDAGGALRSAALQEIGRRTTEAKAAQDKADKIQAENRSGQSADIPTARVGARPLSVERGIAIMQGAKGRKLLPQERGYLDALRQEIGNQSFDLIQRHATQPFRTTMAERKFDLPRVIEENNRAIQTWDNPTEPTAQAPVQGQPAPNTLSAKPTSVKYNLPGSTGTRVDSPAQSDGRVDTATGQPVGNSGVAGSTQGVTQPSAGAFANRGSQTAGAGGLTLAPRADLGNITLMRNALQAQNKVAFTPSYKPLNADFQAASALSNFLGKTFTVIKRASVGGDMPNGFVDSLGGKNVYIDENSPTPALEVAVHELVHGLPARIRNSLVKALNGMLGEDGKKAFLKEYRYEKLEASRQAEEVGSYLAQLSARRPDFWQELRVKMGNKDFSALAAHILAKFKEIFGGAQSQFDAEFAQKYGVDLAEVQRLVTDAYAQAMREQGMQPDENLTGPVMATKPESETQTEPDTEQRQYKLEVDRADRTTGAKAAVSAAEVKAITDQALALGLDSKQAAALVESARETRKRFPPKDGWAPIEATGVEAKKDDDGKVKYDKKGNPQVSVTWKPISYAFNVPPGKSQAPAKMDQTLVGKVADQFTKMVEDIYARADAGDKNAQIIVGHQTWYRNVAEILRREFGGQGDLFADLLGATSPNTPVDTNWRFAIEILTRFGKGEFDAEMPAFIKYMEEGGKSTKFPGTKIQQASGKLYGMNSRNAMLALADLWRAIEAGTAPKARNFALNLIGQSNMATIDVWAARMLRRAANNVRGMNLPRIPTVAEQGVTGNWNANTTAVTGEFGFGAAVLDKVSADLAKKGIDLAPPDLQALAWFAEKELWTEKNWTSAQGEGGSFEENIEANPTNRYLAGWSIQQGEKTPDPAAVSTAQARVLAMLTGDPSVVAARVLPTYGLYGGVVEQSFDTEWTVAAGQHDPSLVLAEIAKLASENGQYDMFVSRVVGPKENNPNARPGVEIYFKTKRDLQAAMPVLQEFVSRGQDGFTMAVDPRAKGGENFIGVRLQYVPEISMRWDEGLRKELMAPGGIENALLDKESALADIVRDVRQMDGVAYATMQSYDTVVVGKENYDEYIDGVSSEAGKPPGGSPWFGRPIRQGLEGAVARYEGNGREDSAGGVPDAGGTSTVFSNKPASDGLGGVYAERGQGVRAHAVRVNGTHFSKGQRSSLDGRYFGGGLKGAEQSRLAEATDPRIKERVYFYVDEGKGVTPEAGVGGVAHAATIDNLYNVKGDPLKLFRAGDTNGSESRVLDAGFDGYYFPNYVNGQGIAIVMGNASRGIAVKPTDYAKGSVPAAPEAPYKRGLTSKELNALDLAAVQAVAPSAKLRTGTLQIDRTEVEAARAELAKQGIDIPADGPAFSNKPQNLDQDITLELPLDTGKTAKLTVNAKSYIDSLNAREDALRMVKECLA